MNVLLLIIFLTVTACGWTWYNLPPIVKDWAIMPNRYKFLSFVIYIVPMAFIISYIIEACMFAIKI